MARMRLVLAGAVLMGLVPLTSRAQSCGTINTTCASYPAHDVTGWIWTAYWRHSECMYCIDYGQIVAPEVCHPACGGQTPNPEEYQQVIAAASQGKLQELLTHVAGLEAYVKLNDQRHAVQVYSCDKQTVVASLPIPDVSTLLVARRTLDTRHVASAVHPPPFAGLELPSQLVPF